MKTHRYILFIILAILFQINGKAQSRFGQYGAYKMLGHTNLLNPALIPEKKLTLDLPLPPTIYVSGGNTLSFSDVFTKQDDGLYHFNSDRLLRKLNRNNYFKANADIQLVFFGLKKDDQYFSFNINPKVNARVTYPRNLISWPLEGTGTHSEMKLKDFSVKAAAYTEFGFGYSRKFSEQLTLGARLKVLKGIGFVKTNFTGSIVTGIDSIYLQHGPASVQTMDIEKIEELTQSPAKMFLNKNSGLGLDFGGFYELNSNFKFSASLTDLGFTRWKDNTIEYSIPEMSYSFRGINITNSGNNISALENDLDSLINRYEIIEDRNVKTSQSLNTKFYGGAHYYPHEHHQLNFLIYSELYNGKLENAFSLGYNFNVKQILSFGLNYSYKNGSFNHLGMMTALRLSIFQFYLLTDNLNINLKSNEADFQIGFSMAFGKSEEKKQKILERKERKQSKKESK